MTRLMYRKNKKCMKLLSNFNEENVADIGHDNVATDILINKRSMKIEKLCKYALLATGFGAMIYNLDMIYTGELLQFEGTDYITIASELMEKARGIVQDILNMVSANEIKELIIATAEIVAPFFFASRLHSAYKKDKFETKVLSGDYRKRQGIIRGIIHALSERKIEKRITKARQSLIKDENYKRTAKNTDKGHKNNSTKSKGQQDLNSRNDDIVTDTVTVTTSNNDYVKYQNKKVEFYLDEQIPNIDDIEQEQ